MNVVLFFCIFAAGVVSSMVGQGGGVIYTPIQLWFKVDIYQAATTSLFLIIIMSLSSSMVFIKAGRIDWPLAIVLESVTTSAAFVGGHLSAHIAKKPLLYVLAAAIVVAGISMIIQSDSKSHRRQLPSGFLSWRRFRHGQQYSVNLAIAIPVSALAGFVSGLVGIGGGILKVAAMVLLLGVPMDIAVGTSSVMVGITAAGGFAGHVIQGHWHWQNSLVFAIAVFAGGQIGSRISIGMNKRMLEEIFGWLLLAVSALTIMMNQ
jgi:uncharacterized membrane protein YfcA